MCACASAISKRAARLKRSQESLNTECETHAAHHMREDSNYCRIFGVRLSIHLQVPRFNMPLCAC